MTPVSPVPTIQDAMLRQGYVFSHHSRCMGCMEPTEWWVTPAKEKIQMNPMPLRHSPAVPHFANCKQQQLFG